MLRTFVESSRFARELVRPFRDSMRLAAHRARWRSANGHNLTRAETLFPIDRVSVGRYTYGPLNLHFFLHPDERVTIGNLCSIGPEVHILAGGEHDFAGPSSYPIEFLIGGGPDADAGSEPKGPVVIHDDVWIGRGCIILSGVTIGQGAVIGAGSLVAKNVPDYAIFAGGRVLKYRFPEEDLGYMRSFDWAGLTRVELLENLELLTRPLSPEFYTSDVFRRHQRGDWLTSG